MPNTKHIAIYVAKGSKAKELLEVLQDQESNFDSSTPHADRPLGCRYPWAVSEIKKESLSYTVICFTSMFPIKQRRLGDLKKILPNMGEVFASQEGTSKKEMVVHVRRFFTRGLLYGMSEYFQQNMLELHETLGLSVAKMKKADVTTSAMISEFKTFCTGLGARVLGKASPEHTSDPEEAPEEEEEGAEPLF